jgi:hypothetical protein
VYRRLRGLAVLPGTKLEEIDMVPGSRKTCSRKLRKAPHASRLIPPSTRLRPIHVRGHRMKLRIHAIIALCCVPPVVAAQPQAAESGQCTPAQNALPATRIDADEAASHRRFRIPTIDYPFGTRFDGEWGASLALRIDERGRVVCHTVNHWYPGKPMRSGLASALASAKDWQYAPFIRNGKPIAALVDERIVEQELPERHLPMPAAALTDISITLERTACFGTCPAYKVEIHGDGHVAFDGTAFVAVAGKREYHVPKPDIAQLVDDVRAKDIWSMRPSYAASVTDLPSTILTIRVGTQTHRLVDYAGEWVGMPPAVTRIEEEADKVGKTAQWIRKGTSE